MKLKIVLLVILMNYVSGCQSSNVRNVKNVDYSRIAGTWKAEKLAWQIVISEDGLVESAIFPMGEAMVKPNETTFILMKDGGKSSYKSGDFPLVYSPEDNVLEVTINVEKIHIKFLDNEIKGSNKTLFTGTISKDGRKWEGFKVEEFDYGPRFPQVKVTPDPIEFIKVKSGSAGDKSERKTNTSSLQQKQRKAAAIKAYDSALAAIMREPALTLDLIWILKEVLKLAPDEALEQFVNEKLVSVKSHHSLRLLDPNAPYGTLPETLPSGIARFSTCVRAPFGKPRERAVSFISDFLESKESGYILTHQFAVLEWSEQTGLELPKQLRDKRADLLKRMLREQLLDDSYFDLYAERAALLLQYAKPDAKYVAKWIDAIINAQLEDGNWPSSPGGLTYDGQSAVVNPPVSHTTVLSLWALRIYIDEY